MLGPGQLVSTHPLSASDRAHPVISARVKCPFPPPLLFPAIQDPAGPASRHPALPGSGVPACSCLGFAPGAARVALCFGSCLQAGRPGGALCCHRLLCRTGSTGPQHGLAQGHPLLQLCNFPQKTSLEEAAGGLRGVKGSVAFLVFGKTFLSPFVLLSLPRAARAEPGRHQPAAACTRDTL